MKSARIYRFPAPQDREGRSPGARRSPLRSSGSSGRRWPMSHKATDWAWEQPVRGVRQHVLLALAERANVKTGKCTPSLGELSARTGLGESTIRGHIQALATAGLIDVKITQGGRRQRSTYTMLISKRLNTPQELEGIESEETPQELEGNASETPQELDPKNAETLQELEKNPPGAGPVVPNTRTREPGREAVAVAPPAPTDGLFDEPVTPASIDRKRVKLAQAIADRYCELEPMSKYVSVLGIVRRPLETDRFTGEMVMAAVERIAKEHRTLTLETLRVELVGFTPRTNGSHRNDRAPLRERLKQGGAA